MLALAVALALPGCAFFLPHLETPRLSIVRVDLTHVDLFEQRLKVRMRVQNPNDRSLPVKGLSYTLDVDGKPFAQGVSAASFVVPAFGETEFDMYVTANAAGTLLHLLGRGHDTLGAPVPYRITGKVALSRGWLRSIPFEQHGSFSLEGLE